MQCFERNFVVIVMIKARLESYIHNSLLRISLICAFRIFSRFRTAFDVRRSTQAWLQNLAPFQVFINTSVIQDKTLTIYINFGKFKLDQACNQACVERRPSNAVRKREKIRNAHISEMRSNTLVHMYTACIPHLVDIGLFYNKP